MLFLTVSAIIILGQGVCMCLSLPPSPSLPFSLSPTHSHTEFPDLWPLTSPCGLMYFHLARFSMPFFPTSQYPQLRRPQSPFLATETHGSYNLISPGGEMGGEKSYVAHLSVQNEPGVTISLVRIGCQCPGNLGQVEMCFWTSYKRVTQSLSGRCELPTCDTITPQNEGDVMNSGFLMDIPYS